MIEGIKRFYTTGHIIERYTEGAEGFGGSEGTWATHLEIDGRLRPLSGDEQLSADKLTVFADHKLYTSLADIKETDRYKDPDGNIYRIKFIKEPMKWGNHLEIYLERKSHEQAEDEEND